jgi:hypothetical protein
MVMVVLLMALLALLQQPCTLGLQTVYKNQINGRIFESLVSGNRPCVEFFGRRCFACWGSRSGWWLVARICIAERLKCLTADLPQATCKPGNRSPTKERRKQASWRNKLFHAVAVVGGFAFCT